MKQGSQERGPALGAELPLRQVDGLAPRAIQPRFLHLFDLLAYRQLSTSTLRISTTICCCWPAARQAPGRPWRSTRRRCGRCRKRLGRGARCGGVSSTTEAPVPDTRAGGQRAPPPVCSSCRPGLLPENLVGVVDRNAFRASHQATQRDRVEWSARNRTLPSTITQLQPPWWKPNGSSLAPQLFCIQLQLAALGALDKGRAGRRRGWRIEPPIGIGVLVDDLAGVVDGAAGVAAEGAGDAAAAGVRIGPAPHAPGRLRRTGRCPNRRRSRRAGAARWRAGRSVGVGGKGMVGHSRWCTTGG